MDAKLATQKTRNRIAASVAIVVLGTLSLSGCSQSSASEIWDPEVLRAQVVKAGGVCSELTVKGTSWTGTRNFIFDCLEPGKRIRIFADEKASQAFLDTEVTIPLVIGPNWAVAISDESLASKLATSMDATLLLP